VVRAAAGAGYPLVEMRARTERASAWAAAGRSEEAATELRAIVEEAEGLKALLIGREARKAAGRLGVELPPEPEPAAGAPADPVVPQGERLVSSLFADVRGYSELSSSLPPESLTERMRMLYRLARVAVERRQGIVDKFAGDAVMATFNVSGTRVDHAVQALEAAFGLRDKAALIGLQLGIGIAVGPAILGRGASRDNIAVTGISTNLAARLQVAARAGEVLLSDEAYRRVRPWLGERGLIAERQELELKGFDGAQVTYRLAAPEPLAVG
jgi:adenylate cyclase